MTNPQLQFVSYETDAVMTYMELVLNWGWFVAESSIHITAIEVT
jgi:hypothetical protein